MKSSRKLVLPRFFWPFRSLLLLLPGLTARGDLVEWLQNLESNGRFEAVFFRSISLLGGPVSRSPPTWRGSQRLKRPRLEISQ